ncbi:MAG TPA: helix-turn-helix domain-containing protein [Candidatus Paceibacterota bacterium]|jgi:sugar-specific transcriptional regulator TrmB|nr:helix-turn-helix domain-containing protein [Candidatus Paceibacterota bacterium]
MENPALVETLAEMGLNKKSAALYLSLLGKSRMGVAELARESGIKRATCYEHLDELLQKDFVTRTPIGKRTYYSAVGPDKVLAAFKKKTAKLEERVDEMLALHERATNKPKVIFYEGKREMRRIYDDLFKTVGDTYSIFPAEEFFKSFSRQEYDEFDKENSAHAFKTRDLFIANPKLNRELRQMREKNGYDNKADKRLPDWFKSNVDVLIFSDKVALISLRDLSAIVIENQDIAELFKNMHQFMWKGV